MWEHYKKTFVRMQFMIAFVAITDLLLTRNWISFASLVVILEVFSVYGALWGARVKQFARSRRSAG
jgi:hypothetical protein